MELFMRYASTIILLCCFTGLDAQNPITPAGRYFADPAAHVWDDGILYLYGSKDESCNEYCSGSYDVYFTHDMVHWEMAEEVFSSRGINDRVSYNDHVLYAPDAMENHGAYYLYYCQPDPVAAEGVAISDSPVGPFSAGTRINTYGHEQIDPSVFVDDDGQAYYLWGQFSLKMARMNPDMITIDSSTIRDNILTESRHHFHEGAFLTRRDDLYYLVYADISRESKPSCIGYATAVSPFGPYTYRGVIIDNDGCDPANWNNHGSIAEYLGQWYVFYHRTTHGCQSMRKACVEPIFFNEDGTIDEVQMTSNGAGPPLPAAEMIGAERACLLHGNVRIEEIAEDREALTCIRSGDRAIFRYISFSGGADSVTVKFRKGPGMARIVIAADKPWHERLAAITLDESPASYDWTEASVPINRVEGNRELWLLFYGDEKMTLDIDWLYFH